MYVSEMKFLVQLSKYAIFDTDPLHSCKHCVFIITYMCAFIFNMKACKYKMIKPLPVSVLKHY